MKVRLDWDAAEDAARRYWRIYQSASPDSKGRLIAELDPDERSYILPDDIDPGDYHWYILAVAMGGLEEDWRKYRGVARQTVTYTMKVPKIDAGNAGGGGGGGGGAGNAGAGVAGGGGGNVQVAAPPAPMNSVPLKLQVVKGTSGASGQLMAEIPVPSSDPSKEGGRSETKVTAVATPGALAGTQSITLRYVTAEGKVAGPETTVTVPAVAAPNHTALEVASVVGATLVGLSSPATSQPWEVQAGIGLQTREVPAGSAASDADGWRTILDTLPGGCRYTTGATITFTTKDLGAEKEFALECHDEFGREGADTKFSTLPGYMLEGFPAFPEIDEQVSGTPLGVMWLGRFLDGAGRLTQPMEPVRWQYRVTSVSATAGDWQEYVPMAVCRGRWVQARMIVTEPLGQTKLTCYRAHVRAWLPWSRLVSVTSAGDIEAHSTVVPQMKVNDGADFTAGDPTVDGELGDIAAGQLQFGVRTDAGNRRIMLNIGGTLYATAITSTF